MRYLSHFIKGDLADNKIVLLSGPRQSGKTTLARSFVDLDSNHGTYLNWDSVEDQNIIRKKGWGKNSGPVILDEIHKYSKWKNFIKGIWDTNVHKKEDNKFILTGSARLDTFKKGGDSLLGRAFHWHLHPFCLTEIKMFFPEIRLKNALERLIKYGGFPETFLKEDLRFLNRWKAERFNKILREDLRDLEKIQEIDQIRFLLDLVRERVGATISASNLALDLSVAPRTIQRWLVILNKMFLTFPVLPYAGKLSRTLTKASKLYFYDNSDVSDENARLENVVASHLFKEVQFRQDAYGENYELRFIRDKEKREVDFVILKDKKVYALVEVKKTNDKISTALKYYKEKLAPKFCYQVVFDLQKNYEVDDIKVVSAVDFLSNRELR